MPLISIPTYQQFDDDDLEDKLGSPTQLEPMVELPVNGAPAPDRKWMIDRIIRELDQGQFVNAGKLGDAIKRDARIMGCMEQRNAGLFGAPMEFEASEDDNKLADQVRDELEDGHDKMFPRASLEEIHEYGIIQGIGIAEKVWDTSKKPWTFTIRPYHPQFYLWLWATHSYYVMTKDNGLQRVPEGGNTRWMIYTPYGYSRAYLRGRLRALVDPWMARSWTKSDWSHYCEVHGHPIKVAIVPQMASPKQETEYVSSISKMGSNTTIKAKQDSDGNKYDVKLLEAMSRSWETFEHMLQWCDKEISQVLLGQSMSTDGQGGLAAQEKPGEAVRVDIKMADNEKLSEWKREQGYKDYCRFNYDDPELAPYSSYGVEPDEDELKAAQAFSQQATADKTYIDAGVLTPEEVALSRAGEGKFAEYDELDVESRKSILSTSLEQLKAQSENELEMAKNPPPPVQPGIPGVPVKVTTVPKKPKPKPSKE